VDPIIGNRSILIKCVFLLPGSLERNLTDLPPRSISIGVYVGIQISQGKIHYVPCVLYVRTEKKMRRGLIFVLMHFQRDLVGLRWNVTCPFSNKQKLTKLKMTKVY
jgi:hypothetical protein